MQTDFSSVLSKALSALELGQNALALNALDAVKGEFGSRDEWFYARALVLIRLDRKEDARHALEAGLKCKPGDANMVSLLNSLPESSKAESSRMENEKKSGWQPVNASGPYAVVGPTPTSLAQFASSPECWDELMSFHGELATDAYVQMVDGYYRKCRAQYGKYWHYLDAVNTLFAAAKWLQPKHYLEIGVRRGRTACTVARACPSVHLHAFDMWIPGYAGMDNPGPDFVRNELRKQGHRGDTTFTDGDSHVTVPAYLNARPNLELDLILVDGDHSEDGALADLLTVLPRLRKGGVLVFDDIVHPAHPYLLKVWRKALEKQGDCSSHEFTEAGYGVAFAVKRG